MSDNRRKHLTPKRYAERRPIEEGRQPKDGSDLKTRKQRRAHGKRSWRKELA